MILFIDGFGHYETDQLARKWSSVSEDSGGGTTTFEITAEGRFNQCLRKTQVGTGFSASGYVEKAPLMTQAGSWTQTPSGVCGFALKVDDLTTIPQAIGNHHTFSILEIKESTHTALYISLNSDGTFEVFKQIAGFTGDASQSLGTSLEGLRSARWYYVEVQWNLHATTGYVEIRVNGVVIFRYDGDTHASSFTRTFTDIWTAVRLLNCGSNSTTVFRMCDFYMLDLTGSGDQKRDYLGDVIIDYIVPVGVGAFTQWTPLSGANWDNVEEVPPDDDTTYNSAATVNLRDSYTMQDVPTGTTPLVFQALIYAKKLTEGASSLKPVFRAGGVNYDSNTQGVASTSDYNYIIQPYDTNPATGNTITESEINAAEFGVIKVI